MMNLAVKNTYMKKQREKHSFLTEKDDYISLELKTNFRVSKKDLMP